jgi:hypothetical protein
LCHTLQAALSTCAIHCRLRPVIAHTAWIAHTASAHACAQQPCHHQAADVNWTDSIRAHQTGSARTRLPTAMAPGRSSTARKLLAPQAATLHTCAHLDAKRPACAHHRWPNCTCARLKWVCSCGHTTAASYSCPGSVGCTLCCFGNRDRNVDRCYSHCRDRARCASAHSPHPGGTSVSVLIRWHFSRYCHEAEQACAVIAYGVVLVVGLHPQLALCWHSALAIGTVSVLIHRLALIPSVPLVLLTQARLQCCKRVHRFRARAGNALHTSLVQLMGCPNKLAYWQAARLV